MRARSLAAALLALAFTSACGRPQPPSKKVDWTTAGDGPVAPLVAAARAQADREGRRLLVYVGASWCEPCRRFHDAVKRGALDAELGQLRFVEFDRDRDEARLRDAGYGSRLIPLIALPEPDGRSSARRMEGSVKGEGAVAEMVPRLRSLLQ